VKLYKANLPAHSPGRTLAATIQKIGFSTAEATSALQQFAIARSQKLKATEVPQAPQPRRIQREPLPSEVKEEKK